MVQLEIIEVCFVRLLIILRCMNFFFGWEGAGGEEGMFLTAYFFRSHIEYYTYIL